jgi:hypothetical protein
MDVTKAPESDDVTKKVKIIIIASHMISCEKGNCSRKINNETAMSLLIGVLRDAGSINS